MVFKSARIRSHQSHQSPPVIPEGWNGRHWHSVGVPGEAHNVGLQARLGTSMFISITVAVVLPVVLGSACHFWEAQPLLLRQVQMPQAPPTQVKQIQTKWFRPEAQTSQWPQAKAIEPVQSGTPRRSGG
jgi:hypothetical protein